MQLIFKHLVSRFVKVFSIRVTGSHLSEACANMLASLKSNKGEPVLHSEPFWMQDRLIQFKALYRLHYSKTKQQNIWQTVTLTHRQKAYLAGFSVVYFLKFNFIYIAPNYNSICLKAFKDMHEPLNFTQQSTWGNGLEQWPHIFVFLSQEDM